MKKIFYFAFMGALLGCISSCKKEEAKTNDPPATPPGCVKTVVEVGSAVINTPTVWDSCHIYHCAYFVGIGTTGSLTIEAGTIVKFDAQKGISAVGLLTVKGTAAHPVIFTSTKDDSYGGDNNGDGNATSPNKGDWQHITLGTSSGNSFDYCKILYAGYGTVGLEQALNMGDGDNNKITNSVIAHTAGNKDQTLAALNMSWCPQSCVAQNNTFFDNGHPLSIGISTDIDNSNVFHNPDNQLETNAANGIFVDIANAQDQAQQMTWSETEVAFVFGNTMGNGQNSWAMDAGKKLILGNDVVLKFATHVPNPPGFSILLPSGSSQLENFDGPGVAFTALSDDSRKGDTNGDGASVGSAGYWYGIYGAGPTYYTWPNKYFSEK